MSKKDKSKFEFSFRNLAELGTPTKPRWKGLIVPFQSLGLLLGASLSIAASIWMWGSLLVGIQAAFLPFLGVTAVGVIAAAAANFFFHRDIILFVLNGREIFEGQKLDPKNPVEVVKLVNALNAELNAANGVTDPKDPNFIPPPRVGHFTSHDPKIVTIEGRHASKSALYFTDGFFNSHETKMDQRQIAALIMVELVKIHRRRGVSSTLVGMVRDLLYTLENVSEFHKAFSWFAAPFLQFFLFIALSVGRSHTLDAHTKVEKLGRGLDLIEAIEKQINPMVIFEDKPLPAIRLAEKKRYMAAQQRKRETAREGRNGFWSKITDSIDGWIDGKKWATDRKGSKNAWRLWSVLEIIVNEFGTLLGELRSTQPRNTSKLRNLYGRTQYDTWTDQEQVEAYRIQCFEKNLKHYQHVKEPYEAVAPYKSGEVLKDGTVPNYQKKEVKVAPKVKSRPELLKEIERIKMALQEEQVEQDVVAEEQIIVPVLDQLHPGRWPEGDAPAPEIDPNADIDESVTLRRRLG